MSQGYVASTQWSVSWNEVSFHLPCCSLYINLPPPHSFSTFLRNQSAIVTLARQTYRSPGAPVIYTFSLHISTGKYPSPSVQISYLLDFILSSSILDPLVSQGLPSRVGVRCLVRQVINRLSMMGRATMKCSRQVKKTLTFQVKRGIRPPLLLP